MPKREQSSAETALPDFEKLDQGERVRRLKEALSDSEMHTIRDSLNRTDSMNSRLGLGGIDGAGIKRLLKLLDASKPE